MLCHVTPLLKILNWLFMSLKVNGKVLTMISKSYPVMLLQHLSFLSDLSYYLTCPWFCSSRNHLLIVFEASQAHSHLRVFALAINLFHKYTFYLR